MWKRKTGCNSISAAVQRQTAVTAYFSSKQLLLFVFELQDSFLPSSTWLWDLCRACNQQEEGYTFISPSRYLIVGFPPFVNDSFYYFISQELLGRLQPYCTQVTYGIPGCDSWSLIYQLSATRFLDGMSENRTTEKIMLLCKAKRQYPLTLQVSRYCILAAHGSMLR